MKKVNISEASVIVGGGGCGKTTCSISYSRGTDGACLAVTTCRDKHGKTVSQTRAPTDSANCTGLP